MEVYLFMRENLILISSALSSNDESKVLMFLSGEPH